MGLQWDCNFVRFHAIRKIEFSLEILLPMKIASEKITHSLNWQKLLLKSVITVGLLSWVTKGLEKSLQGNNFPFFLKRSNQCKFAEQWHILMWIEQIMRDHLWQNNKNLLEKMFNRIFLYHIYCFYSSINNEESTNCLEYFDTLHDSHICCWKNIF